MSQFLKLKPSNCKNCYNCIRHCPVKSIRFSGNQAHIVEDECILCGECFVVCPQNAKQIEDSTEQAKYLISTGAPVVASVAPSFIANYEGVGIEELEKSLKKLGFAVAEETAVGATMVKREYDGMLKTEGRDIVISSCCHSVNLLIRRHYPWAIKYLADVVSPMRAHCRDIKRRIPEAKTVFIGPCVSKKDEAERFPGDTDCVLTFEELTRWLESENAMPEKGVTQNENSRARLFPTTGGILKTMNCDAAGYTYMAIDGVDNCIEALKDIEQGNLSHCFIEMSACVGSCIGGPVMEKFRRSPVRDFKAVSDYAGKNDFDVKNLPEDEMHCEHGYIGVNRMMPGKLEIEAILKQMGKTKPEDELNCGSCGYKTCRDKAIAVYQGKADLNMCLPFLKEKAENFSDNIINNTPNGIIVLNGSFEVQQINKAALGLLGLHKAADVMGEPVVRILDPTDFLEVQRTGMPVRDKRTYLAEYNKFVEQTIVCDNDYNLLICIMRDVTEEENERRKRETLLNRTTQTADKVVDKQMRVVQEIASLLGETAAETKIALTKLKESLNDE